MTADVIVGGLLQGAYFLLMGLGVVLVYRQSGVLNFAHGATATLSGYAAYSLMQQGVAYPVAALGAIATGAIVALLIELLVVRPLANQEHMIIGVATFGPGLIIIAFIGWVWGQAPFALRGPLPDVQLTLGPVRIGANELFSIVVAFVLLGVLYWFLNRTRFGLSVRAASEGPLTADMLGIDVPLARSAVWAISGALAAIAALLISPHNVLGPSFLTDFMIGSFAAIVLGGMESIVGLAVGSLLFGLITAEFAYYVSGRLQSTLNFVLITVLLLVLPYGIFGRRLERVAEPRIGSVRASRFNVKQVQVRVPVDSIERVLPRPLRLPLALAVIGVLLALLPFGFASLAVFTVASMGVMFIATAGQNLLSGYSGQISIGQAGFITIGAYTFALLGHYWNMPPVVGVLVAIVLSAVVAIAFGMSTIRLSGVYLALLTLAFASAVPEIVAYPQEITGGQLGMPVLPGFEVAPTVPTLSVIYWIIAAVAFAVGIAAHVLGGGWFGRRLIAVRDSEAGAASVGIPVARTKLVALTLAGGAAGLAGALSAMLVGFIAPDSYTVWLSVYLLVAVVIGGRASTLGSVLGAIFIVVVPVLASSALASSTATVWSQGFFGVAVLAVLWLFPGGLASIVRFVPVHRRVGATSKTVASVAG
jgi:branched-chain amino acid transport system permease protein